MEANWRADSVFILWHVLPDDEFREHAKLIGVYQNRDNCERTRAWLKHKPGFRDFPDGFEIEEYRLNKDHWTEGFGLDIGLDSD